MKKTLSFIAALLTICALLTACAQGGVAGKWQDESGMMTLNLKADGTGTLEAYVAMFDSTVSNDIRYEKDSDGLKIYFEDDTDYELATIADGKLTYLDIVFTKK